ncbi:MAG: GntR family transcriptional regulator [Tepidisphaeraceae bacterium]
MAERSQRLSYKFQRLRERLREAIETGVLSGKLPGERVLARQFRVNAKTLSKALTDLAAEGLLDRTIGRGTFVRGSAPEQKPTMGKWLVLVDGPRSNSPVVHQLVGVNAEAQVVSDHGMLRPSFITGTTAVIDLHGATPEPVLRDLMLRSLKVVLVDCLPKTYSTHAVLIDRIFCAARLARMMLNDGATHLAVIDIPDNSDVLDSVRSTARQFGEHIKVEAIAADQAANAFRGGATGFIAGSFELGSTVSASLKAAGIDVPSKASVGAMGFDADSGVPHKVSGFAVAPEQLVETVRQLICDAQIHRPMPLWLVGAYTDHGTIHGAPR